MKRLAALFWELFKLSALVIGGGYAIIVVADQLFARKRWTKEGELLEELPVFQMIPGLIATHTAVYIGNKVAGGLGAAIGVMAVALPSVVIFTLVSMGLDLLPLGNIYLEAAMSGLRAALTGIIAAAVIKSAQKILTNRWAWSMMLAALAAMTLFGAPAAMVIVASMLAGLISVRWPAPDAGNKLHSVAWPMLLFLKYGLLGFGGGFVLVPMYLEDFVGESALYLHLSASRFADIMALSQMTPGPIGVNCATFFGYQLAGVGGAVLASALLLIPGSLIAWVVIRSLDHFESNRWVQGIMRGIRPTSISLMLIALGVFARHAFVGWLPIVIALAVAALAYFRRVNVVLLIISSGILSALLSACIPAALRF